MKITGRLALACSFVMAASASGGDSPRVNPTVELIRRVKSAVVPVFAFGTNDSLSSGAGAVIHPAGYILTADHVTRDLEGVVLFGLTREPYKVIGRLPEKDLAILKVAGTKPRDSLPLGRSSEVLDGESVIAIGNPGGRGIVYSQGIVSCASMDPSWPSVLSQTYWRDSAEPDPGRDDYIQFDAASNRGNSGGPLINAEGELIGIVAAKRDGEEAINWAIPVDRARRFFNYLVQPEEMGNFWAGLEVDLLAPRASVSSLSPNSPAVRAGLTPGDTLVTVNGAAVRCGPDWLLLLSGHKAGDVLEIESERSGRRTKSSLSLVAYPLLEPAAKKGKSPGLSFAVYRPTSTTRLHKLPDFSSLKPIQEGSIMKLTPDDFVRGNKENYAVVFRGFLEFPKPGLYRVILASDDGSKCYLNQHLLIDNDFGHPPLPLSRCVRVAAGLIPFRLEYFQGGGGRALSLQIQYLDTPGQDPAEPKFYRD